MLLGQTLEADKQPFELHLAIGEEHGTKYPCLTCGALCLAHDFDMDREQRPVIFAVPGQGKECLKTFAAYLKRHNGYAKNIIEVVCDMSPAFIATVSKMCCPPMPQKSGADIAYHPSCCRNPSSLLENKKPHDSALFWFFDTRSIFCDF